MIGIFLIEAVANLLKMAQSTSDPNVAAGLLDKATEINDRIHAAIPSASDASPNAPDVQDPAQCDRPTPSLWGTTGPAK